METPTDKPLVAPEIIKSLEFLTNAELIKLGVKLGLHQLRLEAMKESVLYGMVEAWLGREDEVDATSGKPSWHSLITTLEENKMSDIASYIKATIYDGQTSRHHDVTEQTSCKYVGWHVQSGSYALVCRLFPLLE